MRPLSLSVIMLILIAGHMALGGVLLSLTIEVNQVVRKFREFVAALLLVYTFANKVRKKYEYLWRALMEGMSEASNDNFNDKFARASSPVSTVKMIMNVLLLLVTSTFMIYALGSVANPHFSWVTITIVACASALTGFLATECIMKHIMKKVKELTRYETFWGYEEGFPDEEVEGWEKLQAFTESFLFKRIVERYSNSRDPSPIFDDGEIVNLNDCLTQREINNIEYYASKA